MMIYAMILAAGESKRMGKPKLILPFGETTILGTVINNVLSSKADKILVVLGSDAEKIRKKIENLSLEITTNPGYQKGMLSSVQWGFKNLPENAKAALVCLGDQPGISTVVINKVIDVYKRTRKGIVIPVYKKNRGHPVLIDIKYRKDVKNLNPDTGLRELVYNHPEDTVEVKVETPSILHDIDGPDDYRKELKKKVHLPFSYKN